VSARTLLRDAVRSVVVVNKSLDRLHRERQAAQAQEHIQQLKDAGEVDDSGLGILVARLSDGNAFGEQSFVARLPTPSMATVRTAAYCQLMTLNHKDLRVVCESYPSVRAALDDYAKEKKAQYEETNQKATANASSAANRRSRTLSGMVSGVMHGLSA